MEAPSYHRAPSRIARRPAPRAACWSGSPGAPPAPARLRGPQGGGRPRQSRRGGRSAPGGRGSPAWPGIPGPGRGRGRRRRRRAARERTRGIRGATLGSRGRRCVRSDLRVTYE
eukprot:302499-Pyramimonas_sp.AAC.1